MNPLRALWFHTRRLAGWPFIGLAFIGITFTITCATIAEFLQGEQP